MPLLNKFPRRTWLENETVPVTRRSNTVQWIAALSGAAIISGLIFYILGFRAGEHALRQAGWLHQRLDDAAGELRSNSGTAANPRHLTPASFLATAVPAPPFPAEKSVAAPVQFTRPIPAAMHKPLQPPLAGMRETRTSAYAVKVFTGRLNINIQRTASRLQKMGLPIQVLPPGKAMGAAGRYYRVQAGPFENLHQAESALRRLRSLGIPAFLAH